MTANERRVVGLLSWAHSLNHMPELSFAALIALFQTQFQASLTTLGFIAGAAALASGITSPVGGILSDRLGARRVLIIYGLSTSTACFLVAASTSLVMLGITFTLLGLTVGLYHPVGLSFISRTVRARSMAFGYHGMAGNLGSAIAPALAVALAGLFNWRVAFVLLGVLALTAAIAVVVSRAEETSYRTARAAPASTGKSVPVIGDYLVPLIVVLVVSMLGGFIYRGSLTFMPKHYELQLHTTVFNIDPVTLAGYVTTIALIFGIPGQYIGGWLGERFRREYALVPLAILTASALALLGLISGPVLLVGGALFAFINFMGQPIYGALIADYVPPRLQGSVFGLSFFTAFGLSFPAPYLAGYISDRWGTEWVFRSLVGVELMVGVLALYLFLAALARNRRREAATGAKG